jgi:beta-lactamase superfamily II metal-dependent hydrolase
MATDLYVLNVGAGSCTVVVPPSGRIAMVDVNDGSDQRSYEPAPSDAPLTDPILWFENRFGRKLFRFILSHPDADHMAGLRHVLSRWDVTNFWDIPHNRTRNDEDFRNDEARADWLFYLGVRHHYEINGISWPKRITPLRGDTGAYWSDDAIEIFSPTSALVEKADQRNVYNDASYVLRFSHATTRVLLASDVEEPAWQDMIDAGLDLRANVLVASHHGRRSGFSEEAIKLIRPEITIVSTAKLDPKDDAINDYKRYSKSVFSTRTEGDLQVRMWDDGDVDIYDAIGNLLVRYSDT